MLPGFRSDYVQTTMFDTPIETSGSVRNVCGDFVERLVSRITGARRVKTDCRAETCPDLWFDERVWLECKSVGRSNKVIIYQHRLEKDVDFMAQGHAMFYVIVNHAAKVMGCKTVEEVQAAMCSTLKSVTMFDVPSIAAVLKDDARKIRCVNTMYYSNRGTVHRGVGWCMGINEIPVTQQGLLRVGDKEIPMFASFDGAGQFVVNESIVVPFK